MFEFEPVDSIDLDSENFKFWEGIPEGALALTVKNPEIIGQLLLGREYIMTLELD